MSRTILTEKILELIEDEIKKVQTSCEECEGGMEEYIETLEDSSVFYNEASSIGALDALKGLKGKLVSLLKDEERTIFLKTSDNDIVLQGKDSLIELARREHKEDVEVNEGFNELPSDYPRTINTFEEALMYLQTYYEGRYHNINKITVEPLVKIECVEGETLIIGDIESAREKFLAYVKYTKEDYVRNGDRTEEEVEEEIECMRAAIQEEIYFNEVLVDYGFEHLIKID